MSDETPKTAPVRRTGLSPKEQKLQAMRDKLAKSSSGAKLTDGNASAGLKAKGSFTGKKTAFQRKAT